MTGAAGPLRGSAPLWGCTAVGLAGLGLCGYASASFRIDQVSCATWPTAQAGYPQVLGFLLASVLLSLAWLSAVRTAGRGDGPSLAAVLGAGLLLHLGALLVPPFLSQDPLFYAAIGRSLDHYAGAPYQDIATSLPPGDPFYQALPPHWRHGSSAYFFGFHLICRLVAKIAGGGLALHLKLFQAIGLCAMLGTALLAARAATLARRGGPPLTPALQQLDPERVGPQVAALVLFSPLAVLEGTMGAHNDALMALGTAWFALAVVKRSWPAALLSALLVVSIKASGLLLLGVFALGSVLQRLLRGRTPAARRVLVPALVAAMIAAGVLSVLALEPVAGLLGNPAESDRCSSENLVCLVRMGLRMGLQAGRAAWTIGLFMRAVGLLFIIYCAFAAARPGALLRAAALLIFAYYLYLHGMLLPWYWLSLLPLLPYASPRQSRAMIAITISSLATYLFYLLFFCHPPVSPAWLQPVGGVFMALVVNGPPTALLLIDRRRRVDAPAGSLPA